MSQQDPVTEFELKQLHSKAIPAALERAERYRLLNEPAQAESICLDILRTDSGNQAAIVLLLLSLSDQFADSITGNLDRATALLPKLIDEYQRNYYRGILHERQARAILRRGNPGAGNAAYEKFREAMACYERAEQIRPPENDEALLRWNTCARAIMFARLEPSPKDESTLMLE